MPLTTLDVLRRYGLAVVAVALATAARLALAPVLGEQLPFVTCFVAIVIIAWSSGLGPTLLAVGLSWLAIDHWVLDPHRPPALFRGSKTQLGIAFFAVGITISCLGEAARLARRRSRAEATKANLAQVELETEREWFRITLNSIADAVITTDPAGRVVSLNPVAADLTGWTTSEAAGRLWTEVFRLRDAEPIEAEALVDEASRLSDGPKLLTGPDGTTRSVECSVTPLRSDHGVILGMVVVFRDVTERRRIEEYRQSLAAIVASSEDAILSTDNRGLIRSWNGAAERLYGYSASEAIGQPVSILVPDGQGTATERLGPGEHDGHAIDHYKKRRRTRDGAEVEVSERDSPILDDAGRVVGRAIIDRDMSPQKQAEAALRAGKERLRLALEAGRMGVWDWDIATGEVRWTEDLEPIPGFRPPTFHEFERLVHPDDRAKVARAIARAFEGEASYDIEFRLIPPDNTIRWFASKGQVCTDDEGKPIRMIGVGQDITDRKLAEERQRDSEQRFSRFMQHLPGLAWIKDLEGRYIYANESTLRAFNRGRADLYGKVDGEIFDPTTAATYRENDRKALLSETGFQTIEALRQEGDGILHHSVVSKFPVLGPDGQVGLIGGIAIDITDRMRMEASLRESDRRKDEFIATLAHELRNPLAPIQNALHLLSLPAAPGHDPEAERAMAERQVRHLARLVDDLLDVSRINQGQIELRKELVDLTVIVERAADSVRSLLQERGHRLQIVLSDEPILLDADPTRLEQILGNLLNNAIKYTDPGGRIELQAERDADSVRLRVRDNGLGIEPEMRELIFEMFIQAGRPGARAQGGLGIGLGLVRKLVELHGGTIHAESAGPGTGSEFTVRLPILSQAAPIPPLSKPVEPTANTASLARRRVLVVDDNHDAATSLARVLSRLYGQEVQVAHDGYSALEAARTFRPALILLDIGLPDLDGHEVTRRLRAEPAFQSTQIVALTGWGQDSDVEQSRQAGFDQHLVKPAHPDTIRALLTEPFVSVLTSGESTASAPDE